MTATCIPLPTRPYVDFDEAVLTALCERYGDGAEQHLAQVLTDVETHLALARMQLEQGHYGGLRRTCEDLMPLARSVGMRSLQRATFAVLDCLASEDAVALAACAKRLVAMGRPEVFRDWSTVEDHTVA